MKYFSIKNMRPKWRKILRDHPGTMSVCVRKDGLIYAALSIYGDEWNGSILLHFIKGYDGSTARSFAIPEKFRDDSDKRDDVISEDPEFANASYGTLEEMSVIDGVNNG